MSVPKQTLVLLFGFAESVINSVLPSSSSIYSKLVSCFPKSYKDFFTLNIAILTQVPIYLLLVRINVIFLISHVLQVTSTASDPELGFTITSCFISPNSNPSVASHYTLIETVCPTDDSVEYYHQREFPNKQMEKNSFSFTFNSKFNMTLLFLHCEMSLCSKRSHSNSRLPPVHSVIFF